MGFGAIEVVLRTLSNIQSPFGSHRFLCPHGPALPITVAKALHSRAVPRLTQHDYPRSLWLDIDPHGKPTLFKVTPRVEGPGAEILRGDPRTHIHLWRLYRVPAPQPWGASASPGVSSSSCIQQSRQTQACRTLWLHQSFLTLPWHILSVLLPCPCISLASLSITYLGTKAHTVLSLSRRQGMSNPM